MNNHAYRAIGKAGGAGPRIMLDFAEEVIE